MDLLKTIEEVVEYWIHRAHNFAASINRQDIQRLSRRLFWIGAIDIVLMVLMVNYGLLTLRDILLGVNLFLAAAGIVTLAPVGFGVGLATGWATERKDDAAKNAVFVIKFIIGLFVTMAALHALSNIFPCTNYRAAFWASAFGFVAAFGIGGLRGFKSDVPYRVLIALCVTSASLWALEVLIPGLHEASGKVAPNVTQSLLRSFVGFWMSVADLCVDPIIGRAIWAMVYIILGMFIVRSFGIKSGTGKAR